MEYQYYPPTVRESDWQEAAYVALLLKIPLPVIFPLWVDCTDSDNAHLVEAVLQIVDNLLKTCSESNDHSVDQADDLRTLKYCYEVMNGVPTLIERKLTTLYPDIRDNGYFGQGIFYNFHGYRQGAWTRWDSLSKGGCYG